MAGRRVYLAFEFIMLFGGAPIAFTQGWLGPDPLLLLWAAAAACLAVLLIDRSFDRRRLWNLRAARDRVRPIVLRCVLAAFVLGTVVALLTPDMLLSFVQRKPALWAIVMLLYPVLSVYPQGVLYRAFLFHRYRSLFAGRWATIAASGVAFGFMHVIFGNPAAVILSLAGGLLFAHTYERTRSSAVAGIEHTLYGCFIFTIGWGSFFYHGAAVGG